MPLLNLKINPETESMAAQDPGTVRDFGRFSPEKRIGQFVSSR